MAIPELAGRLTQGPDYVGGAAGDEDHGTWMADVVHQMAPQAHILSVRVVSDVHGSAANMDDSCAIASGIAYAAEHGAKVINLSLGDSDAKDNGYTSCQAKAVEQALADGITVVASAGNDGGAVDPAEPEGENGGNAESFPAAVTGVIGVAAVTPSGTPGVVLERALLRGRGRAGHGRPGRRPGRHHRRGRRYLAGGGGGLRGGRADPVQGAGPGAVAGD